MNNESSYKIENVAVNIDGEIQRLGNQVNLFWEKEIRLYKNAGLVDGMSIVELGCGPGYVLDKLLGEFKKIKVTGIEISPLLVDYASKMLGSKWKKRATVKEGSILNINLADNSYDFAIVRLVLEHLSNPKQAINEVYRILKPGGIAVFIDNDFEMHIMTSPHVKELRVLYDAYCQCRYDEGGNPKIGRELAVLLKQCDFCEIDNDILCAHSGIVGDQRFLGSEGMGIPMQLYKKGYLSSEELSQILHSWKNMMTDAEHSIVRMLFAAHGRKNKKG